MIAERRESRGFRDLDVYQRSFALVRPIYDLVDTLPAVERRDLASQLRREYVPGDVHARFLNEYEILGKMLYRRWQHWRKKLPPGASDE